jgi:hypothetical protein
MRTVVRGQLSAPPTARQLMLQRDLVHALANALVAGRESDEVLQSAAHAYRNVALVLVELRHEFTTSDRRTPDLKGRSAGYRRTVRCAYEQVGATGGGPIEKRLTAGTAYWVRKLLLERYGERRLRELGALPRRRVVRRALDRLAYDPHASFTTAADILNTLAANFSFNPSDQTLRSVARAVVLLQRRRGACTGPERELGAA